MAWIKRGDVTFAGSRAFPGLSGININYGFMSLAAPSRYGTFGLGGTSYNADNFMRENVGLLSYSLMLGKSLSLGANLKYLWHGFNVDSTSRANPVFANGTSKSALTADAGVRVELTDHVALGLLGRNLTEPDVGLASTDRVPSEYQAGISFNPLKTLFVEADGSYRNQQSGASRDKTDYHLGVENWFFSGRRSSFGLRAGFNSYDIAGGFSFNVNSWNLYSLRLDYTYIYNTGLNISEAVTHQVGLTLYFTPNSDDSPKAAPPAKSKVKTKSGATKSSAPPAFISEKSTVKPKNAAPVPNKNKKSKFEPAPQKAISPTPVSSAPIVLRPSLRAKRKSKSVAPAPSSAPADTPRK